MGVPFWAFARDAVFVCSFECRNRVRHMTTPTKKDAPRRRWCLECRHELTRLECDAHDRHEIFYNSICRNCAIALVADMNDGSKTTPSGDAVQRSHQS
jgi:hypothetical protein